MLRKEEFLNRFFYSEFDPAILEERKAHRERTRRGHGEPSTSALKDPKEESTEEMTLDLETFDTTFIFVSRGAERSLMCGWCVMLVTLPAKSLCETVCAYSTFVLLRVYFR